MPTHSCSGKIKNAVIVCQKYHHEPSNTNHYLKFLLLTEVWGSKSD